MLRLLVASKKANLYQTDFEGFNVLHLAVRKGKLDVVKYLVEQLKFSVYDTTTDGHSALSLVYGCNNQDLINYLRGFEKTTQIDDLLDEIESDKKKKSKKTKEKQTFGLGSTDYKESLRAKAVANEKKIEQPLIVTQNISDNSNKNEVARQPIESSIQNTNTLPSQTEPIVIKTDKSEFEAFKLRERQLKEKKEKEHQLFLEQQQKAKEAEKQKKNKPEKKKGISNLT